MNPLSKFRYINITRRQNRVPFTDLAMKKTDHLHLHQAQRKNTAQVRHPDKQLATREHYFLMNGDEDRGKFALVCYCLPKQGHTQLEN